MTGAKAIMGKGMDLPGRDFSLVRMRSSIGKVTGRWIGGGWRTSLPI